ncbi:hypothetical protein ACJBU6_10954 [Exserohilum turcicum]
MSRPCSPTDDSTASQQDAYSPPSWIPARPTVLSQSFLPLPRVASTSSYCPICCPHHHHHHHHFHHLHHNHPHLHHHGIPVFEHARYTLAPTPAPAPAPTSASASDSPVSPPSYHTDMSGGSPEASASGSNSNSPSAE